MYGSFMPAALVYAALRIPDHHAAGHIVAAAKLYGGFIDTFDVLAHRSQPKQIATKATQRRGRTQR
jgi:hypothetical protein